MVGGDSVTEIDMLLRKIKNQRISESLRIANYAEGLCKCIPLIGEELYDEQNGFSYIDIFEREPEFFKKLMKFSFRLASESGHQSSNGLLRLLVENPKIKAQVDPVYLDYAVPFLFERDYAFLGEGWSQKTQEIYDNISLEMMKRLEIDPEKVQSQIEQDNNMHQRKYLQGLFSRVEK